MEKHHVVPDVLDGIPPSVLTLEWGPSVRAEMGNELTPSQVHHAPKVIEWDVKKDALYTLLFTDPDSPNQTDPSRVEVLHWLILNIPGCDVSKGKTQADYIGSLPKDGTGVHRYVYLIFEQPSPITPDEEFQHRYRATEPAPIGRRPFNTRSFAAKHNLGEPIAGNFYIARYDENVPKMRQEVLTPPS